MYLPGTPGERIGDLRDHAGLTREELAERIGVNATTLGRIESGQTAKISDEILTALAREFSVSTDFILGLTDTPDRLNYDIEELGLSVQAAQNLYTRKVNTEVVNQLLESPRFSVLATMIGQFLNDTLAAGVAAQNEVFRFVQGLILNQGREIPGQLGAARQAAQEIETHKTPPYQQELTKLQDTFLMVLKDLKKDREQKTAASRAMTRRIMEQMMAELTKGQDAALASITPEQMADAVLHTVSGTEVDAEVLADLRAGLISLFEELPRG